MSSPGALHAQGREQFRRKQYFDAYRCFLAAADKCTARDTLLLSKIYQSLSQTELILERVKDAIDSATKAIEYDPNNYLGYLRRGNAYCESLKWKNAYDDYTAALKLEPTDQFIKQRLDFVKNNVPSDELNSPPQQTEPQASQKPAFESNQSNVYGRNNQDSASAYGRSSQDTMSSMYGRNSVENTTGYGRNNQADSPYGRNNRSPYGQRQQDPYGRSTLNSRDGYGYQQSTVNSRDRYQDQTMNTRGGSGYQQRYDSTYNDSRFGATRDNSSMRDTGIPERSFNDTLRPQTIPDPAPMKFYDSKPVDVQPVNTGKYNPTSIKELMKNMMNDKRPSASEVLSMIDDVELMMRKCTNISPLNIEGKITIVGDTHGQFQDVINIFETYGYPSSNNPYLFNGDFVDRGSMGVEIMITLLAWKLYDENCMFLNRGNQYVFLNFIFKEVKKKLIFSLLENKFLYETSNLLVRHVL